MSTPRIYELTRECARQARELAISNARHAGFGITGPGTRFYSTQAWLESNIGKAYIARKIGKAVADSWGAAIDPRDWGKLGAYWLSELDES